MIYLSQLTLNPRSRQVQSELRDPYEMHRTLAKAFGDDKEQWEEARCLFRVEDERGALRVLVQSRCEPQWERLSVRHDYWLGPPRCKEFAPALQAGQVLAFRLRANPTVKRDGKRQGLYREEERTAWLHKKGQSHGFALLEVRVRDLGQEHQKQREDGSNFRIPQLQFGIRNHQQENHTHHARFSAAQFDGILRVTDPKALVNAIESGIGSAKGFGFGLLSLARG
jgi:CRISPR system Cascade subunit CasE